MNAPAACTKLAATMKPGVHLQLYMDAAGYAEGLDAIIKEAPSLGVVGLIPHATKSGQLTTDSMKRFRDKVSAAGLQAGAAFGLRDGGDHRVDVGHAIGDVFNVAEYGITDMEKEDMDVDKASALLAAVRERSPDSIIIDQPPARPIPRHHGNPWWRIAARWTTYRGPQFYWNNLRFVGTNADGEEGLGDAAYSRIMPDFENDWAVWVPQNTPAGITPDPLVPTIQGYHSVPWTVVDYQLRRSTTIMWCENHPGKGVCTDVGDRSTGPYPTPSTRAGLRAVKYLRDHGYVVPGRKGIDVVKAYQTAYNLTVAPEKRVKVDGLAGLATQRTMPGVVVGF